MKFARVAAVALLSIPLVGFIGSVKASADEREDGQKVEKIDRRRTIRGRVLGAGKPLQGVLVSDGCRVTRTDGDGHYQLAIGPDSGRFVFVTTTRGWWTDDF